MKQRHFLALRLFLVCVFVFISTSEISAKLLKIQKNTSSHDLFVVNAIPKCGTHCILNTLRLITGKKSISLSSYPEDNLTRAFNLKKFIKCCDFYSPIYLQNLIDHHHKMILMYRDPRDALVSHVFYMRELSKEGRHRDFFLVSEDFDSLSFDDQLSALITGRDDMISYLQIYERLVKWVYDPYVLPVKYEHLVGPQGGGSKKLQMDTINKIMTYLNMTPSKKRVLAIMNNLYKADNPIVQNDKEYKRASLGNWKTFLKPKHKAEFKKKFGAQLIELGYEKNGNW